VRPASTACERQPAPHKDQHAGESDNQPRYPHRRERVAQPDEGHECAEQRGRRIEDGGKPGRDRQDGIREQRKWDRRIDRAEEGEPGGILIEMMKPAATAQDHHEEDGGDADARRNQRDCAERGRRDPHEEKRRPPDGAENNQLQQIARAHNGRL
jgi:hypothetical protein